MYEFIKTATGWLVCWGPIPETHRAPTAQKLLESKTIKIEPTETKQPVMGWELYGV